MLNRSASLAMSTSVLKALPGKLDIKRHSPSILYLFSLSYRLVLRTEEIIRVVVLSNLSVNSEDHHHWACLIKLCIYIAIHIHVSNKLHTPNSC